MTDPTAPRRPRTPMHTRADELIELIGSPAAWEVAAWIRRQRPEARLYLDDYLYDVLRDEVVSDRSQETAPSEAVTDAH